MIKNLLFTFSLLLTLAVSAQDTVHVTTSYTKGQKNEDYFRNLEGNKHGKYRRFTRYGKLYIDGQYNNGSPVGTWNFYSSDTLGELVQKLDFDTHKEIMVDSFRVPSLICGPRYFGGNMLQQEYVQHRIKTDFSETERARLKGTSVLVVFEIDPKTYKPYGVVIEDNALSDDIKAKITKIVNEMPAWLPPVCKGGPPVWRMSVVFLFQ
jgi:hypothetical protein